MCKVRTLLVDDEEDMRVLLRLTIEDANEGLCVSGEAASGEEAVEQVRTAEPEIVVLDNRMPGLSGLETAQLIRAERPQQRILLFTAYDDPQVRAEAAALGIPVLSKSEFADVPHTLREMHDCPWPDDSENSA